MTATITAKPDSAETKARGAARSLGRHRQREAPAHGQAQHNKTIVVDGPKVKRVVCGSTNLTLARVLRAVQQRHDSAGREARSKLFLAAFDDYWQNDAVPGFGQTPSATDGRDLGINGHRRAGRVLTALAAERDAGQRSPKTSRKAPVQPVLLAGIPLPNARA